MALPNLTGIYDCNDGGTYYLRQVGNTLWWYGENDEVTFSNVYRGVINQSANTIRGVWVDVPNGSTTSTGRLNLLGSTNGTITLTRTFATGGFGGSSWTRVATSAKKVQRKIRQATLRMRKSKKSTIKKSSKIRKVRKVR
jgi:hypothetical protein